LDSIQRSIYNILKVYDNPNREGLIDTPRRVQKMYDELLKSSDPKITVFDSNGYDQLIIDKNINYYSLCEHHIIPFFGTVSIGYLPKDHIIGLSKLSRVVNHFSKRLNTQEYFTQNIADYLQDKLQPLGLGVIVTGRHLCKEMRGVKSNGLMITSAMRGMFLSNHQIKHEFLSLIHNAENS
jgi:GTP cyclohydrolase IA